MCDTENNGFVTVILKSAAEKCGLLKQPQKKRQDEDVYIKSQMEKLNGWTKYVSEYLNPQLEKESKVMNTKKEASVTNMLKAIIGSSPVSNKFSLLADEDDDGFPGETESYQSGETTLDEGGINIERPEEEEEEDDDDDFDLPVFFSFHFFLFY